RDSRHHGFTAQFGSAGSRHGGGGRKAYLRQPPVSQTLLGHNLPAFSGKGISATGSRISNALQRSRLFAQILRQADIGAHNPLAAEVRDASPRSCKPPGPSHGT